MLLWFIDIALAFGISAFITAFIIPKILLVSFRKRLFDIPDERKVHRGVIPRLGGVSFFPSILFSLSLTFFLHYLYFRAFPSDVIELYPELLLIICCLIAFYMLGVMDDLIGVRYRQKFGVQIFCGTLLTFSGVRVDNLYGLFGIHAIPWFIGIPITIFIIVYIVNAINLIDGIDGLASGLSGIALAVFGSLFFYQEKFVYAMIAFATLGVLVPFFYYNAFRRAKRKIFMGDTGTMTIGFVLSFLSIKFGMYDDSPKGFNDGAIIIAFSLLIIPMFDVIRVVLCRVRTGKHPFHPDRNHIHHKFLRMGYTPRKAMLSILTIALLFAISNILLQFYVHVTVLLLLDIVAWVSMHLWMNKKIRLHKASSETTDNKPIITPESEIACKNEENQDEDLSSNEKDTHSETSTKKNHSDQVKIPTVVVPPSLINGKQP